MKLASTVIIWETVSAFANTAWWWVVLWVEEKNWEYVISWLSDAEKIESDFLTTLRWEKFNTKVSVVSRKYTIQQKNLLAFYIQKSTQKPIYFWSSIKNSFIRSWSGDQRATESERAYMLRENSYTQKESEWIDEDRQKVLDAEHLREYRTLFKYSNQWHHMNQFSDEDFFERLWIYKDGKTNYAWVIALGNELSWTRYLYAAKIDYVQVPWTEYGSMPYTYRYIIESWVIHGFYQIHDKLMKFVDVPHKILRSGMRDENPAQILALREALVNLCIHTDYFHNSSARIRVFSDRIELYNPWALPKDPDEMMKTWYSNPRNKIVAKLFRYIDLSEILGSWFVKMNGWKEWYNKPPVVQQNFDSYTIVFPLGVWIEKSSEKSSEKILQMMKDNQNVTIAELSSAVWISTRAIEKNIKKLKDSWKISRQWPDNWGYRKVRDDVS